MLWSSLAQMLQKQSHKGAVALVFGGAVGLLATVGAGLIFAALLMGISVLIGAIWASLVLGVLFLGLAAGLVALRKERRPPPLPAPLPLEEVVFTLAFVAARAILRDRPKTSGE